MGPAVRGSRVEGAPHFYIQEQAESEKMGDQGRTAIAQQGQGKAGDRKQTNGHSNIENDVKRHGGDDTEGQKNSKTVGRLKSDVQSFKDEKKIQNEQDGHADESCFLGQN